MISLRARPLPQISMLDALKNEGAAVAKSTTPDLMGALRAPITKRELIAA